VATMSLAGCAIIDDDDGDDGGGDDGGGGGGERRCAPDNGGIDLPEGFCASVFADGLGIARQMTVTPSGVVFVAIGDARDGSKPGHVVSLRDNDDDGFAEQLETFADRGGNGIAWQNGRLFFAQNDRILDFRIPTGEMMPREAPEILVGGLPNVGDHNAKTVVPSGNHVYVNIGSASNACQVENRVPGSPGVDPCPELAVRAGVWRFDTTFTGQQQLDGVRVATGLRNGNALAVDPFTNELWAVQNGRDQLFENWPGLYTPEDDLRLPSEEMMRVDPLDDFGWPYCYHDPDLGKVLAPEYGGDGTMIERCAFVEPPDLVFPAHWAPLSIHFYTGREFPSHFHGGAFVAMHGSRFEPDAVGPEPGYNVVFVPFTDDGPTGRWEPFATGFAGGGRPLPDAAAFRPVGLAQMPDGSLLISDDHGGGRIWRVFRDD
jgi:glucose/arabinose dehydrogenase